MVEAAPGSFFVEEVKINQSSRSTSGICMCDGSAVAGCSDLSSVSSNCAETLDG